MRIKNILLAAAVLFSLAPALQAQTEKSKRPRVAVLEFKAAKESWGGWGWYWGVESQARMSSVLQDLFVTELSEVGSGKIRLIERERLNEIRQEQAFGQSGEVDTATAVKLGKLLGVKYMITGKITRFANQGLETRAMLEIIIEQATVPVVVDAGIGVPSHATQALEMGANAVLVNTAIAVADDPVMMARAFRMAVEAGLLARQSGPGSRSFQAQATSPLTGFLEALS